MLKYKFECSLVFCGVNTGMSNHHYIEFRHTSDIIPAFCNNFVSLTHSLIISWLSAKKVFLLLLISNIHAQHTIFFLFSHTSSFFEYLLFTATPCKNEKGLWEWEKIRLNFNIYNFGKYQDIGALSRTLLSIWWIQPPTAIAREHGVRSALLYFKWFWFIVFVLFIKKTWNLCSMKSKQAPNATLMSSCFPL